MPEQQTITDSADRQRKIPRTTASGSRTARSSTAKWQRWMRWLHVYASMIAFAVILFFGVTGLLLNHPTWLGGENVAVSTIDGVLPPSVRDTSGDGVEFLAVSEYMRSEHGVAGGVTNFDQVGDEGSINYSGPGYGATVRFDVPTLEFQLTVREEGLVNAMRDLHSGSDTGSAWGLLIDVSAGFLVFVAITGLGIQVFLKKRRRRALTWMAGGIAATVVFIWLTAV